MSVPLDVPLDVLPAGSVVTGIVARTGGHRSAVFEVRLAGSDPLIVKRYADGWRWTQAKEVHVYGLLESAGVGPTPRVVRVDRERAITVLTTVPGTPMSQTALTPEAVRAAYRRIGRFQAALHRIAMPAFGYVTTGITEPVADNPTYMRRQFSLRLNDFLAAGGPADLHAAMTATVTAQQRCLDACTGAVLCHNDLHEGNVLVDAAGTVTGFVDVENAVAADPLLDLAKTVQYDLDASPDKHAALFEGYGPLPPRGHERLRLYRLYHSLELWTYFASVGNTGPLPAIADDLRSLVDR
ncbi:aminoglycoside phosphotransferase family protein [Virgisporangium ochraceum]|uniref:aminoglycoside phosphotransferase family protein n=1 Tax=Virgisporangium ochraceum TaxID=65505 RepID=UPI0019407739|nr:aminoglycoside phosphotransferase family protein [Virgisporangium ochraceum]